MVLIPTSRLGDPLGAASINIFRPGWNHAWHFDEAEYTTTLCLQQAEEGGEFEFSAPLRDSDGDLAADAVAGIVNAHRSPVGAFDVATWNPRAPRRRAFRRRRSTRARCRFLRAGTRCTT